MMPSRPRQQRGAVLVVGLLLLVILTVLSTAATQSTVLQERMAGNDRDRNLAFQAAEAALRDAEAYIQSEVAPFSPFQANSFTTGGDQKGLYDSKASPGSFSLSSDLLDTNKTRAFGEGTGVDPLIKVPAQPRYLIELLATSCLGNHDSALLRITVRAQGANPNTVVTLQSLYRRGVFCSGGPGGTPSGKDGTATL